MYLIVSFLRLVTFLFFGFQVLYALLTLVLWVGWLRTPSFKLKPGWVPQVRISVVVVVRNEEDNLPALLRSIGCQTYLTHLYEVLVVDDFSTDATVDLIRSWQASAPFSLQLIELKDHITSHLADGAFKKKAIDLAVRQSAGELIVTTDGDCLVSENWLMAIAQLYAQTQAQMICGGVTFSVPEDTIFSRLQTIEFASLIGSGAATLRFGVPTMCNAANLAFTKAAFMSVGGYRDTASTATGDDLFLMHKIHQAFPVKVFFLKNADAVVHTQPPPTVGAFYQQRKRWASKWNLYRDWRVSGLALFVFLSNLALLAGVLAAITQTLPLGMFFVGILLRWAIEWLFLSNLLVFLRKPRLLGWIPMVQWIYPLYVVFFGLVVQKKGYHWKDRKLKG